MSKKHEGDLIAQPGVVYDFERITGYLDARGADTKTAFPKLTTVGGSLDARGADTKTAFPKLTTVGGYLDASGADTKTAFPKLTTVGGSLYARGANTKTVQVNAGATATDKCRAALAAALALHSLILQDGILSRIVSKKGGVYRVVVVGQTTVSYVIERDGQTAHGATLQLARADLLFKLGNRDTSAYKKWSLESERPLEELVAAYRAITGACSAGVHHFMNGKKYGNRASVAFVLEETRGQYGHEAFATFFGAKE